MMIGYARVSTDGQTLDQQRAELKAAGCKRIFEEKASGAHRGRPELAKMLDHLQPGNVVTVTRLDRLARSTRDLLDIAERIGHAEAGLRSLAEPWADTTTPAGRMVLTFFAGVAEFERSLIHERTSAGRAAAKAKGAPNLPSDYVDSPSIAGGYVVGKYWAVSNDAGGTTAAISSITANNPAGNCTDAK